MLFGTGGDQPAVGARPPFAFGCGRRPRQGFTRLPPTAKAGWTSRTGKPVREFKMRGPIPTRGYPARITMLRFSPDGKVLAAAAYDRTLRLWNLETGRTYRMPLERML
jgi:hypothetical protein